MDVMARKLRRSERKTEEPDHLMEWISVQIWHRHCHASKTYTRNRHIALMARCKHAQIASE